MFRRIQGVLGVGILVLLLVVVAMPQPSLGFMEHFTSSQHSQVNHNMKVSSSLQKPNQARDDLLQVVDQTDNVQLNLQLHIGNDEIGFLSAKDMIIQLQHDAVHNNEDDDMDDDEDTHVAHAPLPGADGYYKDASSGHRALQMLSRGKYVSQEGLQLIDCQRGCWEMCWLKDKPSGTLVCGFHIPQDYHRNDAILPYGDMWLSFPLWTVNGLKYAQYEKQKIVDEIQFNLEKRDEELTKFDHCHNPIMRAIHLRNAFQFAEKCNLLHDDSLDTIPDNTQVEKLQDDLLLSKYGMIWRKHGEGHVLLGHAIATMIDMTNSESTAAETTRNGRLRP